MNLLNLSINEMVSFIEPRVESHHGDDISCTPNVNRVNEIYDQIIGHLESAADFPAIELTITSLCRDRNDELLENLISYSDFESQLSDVLAAAHDEGDWSEVMFIASVFHKASTAYSNLLDAVSIINQGSLEAFRAVVTATN